jgi:hypothetical protein
MSGLLRAAVTVVSAIEHEERPVLVHCSDGWDRTPQIVALAELLLDPYYRTIDVSAVCCYVIPCKMIDVQILLKECSAVGRRHWPCLLQETLLSP